MCFGYLLSFFLEEKFIINIKYIENKKIKKFKVKWNELKNLENLKFIKKYKYYRKKIIFSSSNKELDLLFKINNILSSVYASKGEDKKGEEDIEI